MLLSRGKDSFQSHKPAAREDRSPLDLLPVLADLVTLLMSPLKGVVFTDLVNCLPPPSAL